MKLKAIIASAIAAMALSGLLAGGASASTWEPTHQEFTEHPGMSFSIRCQMSEEQSLNWTKALEAQLEAEGKCVSSWDKEAPDELAIEREFRETGHSKFPTNVVNAPHAKTSTAAKAKRHHRHR
jgi:hypothetical protein